MPTNFLKWTLCAAVLALVWFALWRPSIDYRMILGALVVWVIAIFALKPRARPSIASITDRTPGSQSL
jgi:hypothetical protein